VISVKTSPTSVEVATEAVTIEGSKQVLSLGLQDRYKVDVGVHLTKCSPAEFNAAAAIDLKVDVPMPFGLMPAPVLEAAGNTVMSGMLAALMEAFTASIARDIEQGRVTA
jgi:Protein of unknown function (DUF1997)